MSRRLALSTLALALGAGAAHAADLYLLQVFNLDALCTDALPDGNPYWIGTDPSCIAFDGESLYVGGVLTGPDPVKQSRDPNSGELLFDAGTGEPITEYLGWSTSVVKIENLLAGPVYHRYRALPGSRNQASFFQGYTGLDFAPGAGLITAWDAGAPGVTGQNQRYDTELQPTPTLIASTPAGGAPRGLCGPAWDFGPDGLGVDYQMNDPGAPGYGTLDGPVAAVLDPIAAPAGPLGLDPASLDPLDPIYGPFTGPFSGPVIDTGQCGTIWRDLDISPADGLVAARANNELVIATRDAQGRTGSITRCVPTIAGPVVTWPYACAENPGDPNPDQIAFDPACEGQNVAVLHNYPGGARIVFVNRSDYSSPTLGDGCHETGHRFDDSIRMVDTGGAEQTINWLDKFGLPLVIARDQGEDDLAQIPTSDGRYDFAWEPESRLLLILCAETRDVYVFGTETPPPLCDADVNTTNTNPGDVGYGNPDGTVDGADLSFFIEKWLDQEAGVADLNTTNTNPGDAGYGEPDGVVNGADLSYFIERWLSGCQDSV